MTTNWIVGGNTFNSIYPVSMNIAYQNKILSPAEKITYQAKIGLMYVSVYGYTAILIIKFYKSCLIQFNNCAN